ncbi:primary replicative DNA helicase [Hydrogenispora ethanolica]|jgi:replicative DNA helicase|uniref:Replicative DNA helicase n=1 Tax=Hydrogenispora ethanolica TaxID=1082276 RepID=A0A4R1RHA3_HYDET|nr:replicative DNA helicase [Hydrogenispora ethanolica]TCL65299.1 primary replicative DNA helicase [Hydrogenispora ethanolica]
MSIASIAERIPPQNIDAERSTLGSMFLEKEAIEKGLELLQSEAFYREAHRVIFEVVLHLHNHGEPVDIITVSEELKRRNMLEKIGGIPYLTALANAVPTAANVEYYAKIVAEKALLRSIINTATEIVRLGYEGADEVDSILDQAEKQIFQIAQQRHVKGYVALKSILIDTFERIEQLYENRGGVTGLGTGFRDLDRMTAGLQPSDLIILAARPSMGKTTFALNLARNAAVDYKAPVIVFSLEMSKEQLALKLLCSEAGVDNQRIRTGTLRDEDWPRLSHALGRLSESNIYIDDTPGVTVFDIRAKARRIKAEAGLGLIVIDYLQLMQSRGRSENRQQEVSEISRSLKALARELEVPVISLSQLSRAVEQRTDKTPSLADLRESGSLEQDADIVAFLYREDYYNKETEKKGITDLIIAKQRNGPVGTVELLFQKEFSKFVGLDRQHQI